MSNLHLLSRALSLFAQDHDDQYPAGYGQRANGAWRWNSLNAVPADWRPGIAPDIVAAYRQHWSNTLVPYLVGSYGTYECPAGPEVFQPGIDYSAPLVPYAHTSYTFNGLLSTYPRSEVVVPELVPTFWEGLGKVRLAGFALTSPALQCFIPGQPCVYQPAEMGMCAWNNGGQSTMFTPRGTMLIHGLGENMLMADGHAAWHASNADPNTDPWAYYGPDGIPLSAWNDGCHAWMFRPDRTQ